MKGLGSMFRSMASLKPNESSQAQGSGNGLGHLSVQEIGLLLGRLTAKIQVASRSTYESALAQAKALAPHPEDAPYLALALTLQIPLWSNDLELKKQTAVSIFTTEELLRVLPGR